MADDTEKTEAHGGRHLSRRLYAAVAMVVLAATLGLATYAWFSSNMRVNTNSVSVHSDTSELVLELGDAQAGSWSQTGDVALNGNDANGLTLYPVSTFDLSGFAECVQNSASGDATVFEEADSSHYYHGWLDVRPQIVGTGASKVGGRVNLYLSESLVPAGTDETLLRAARVGLKISSGGQVIATDIFALDGSDSGHRAEHPATKPAGLPEYQPGMLLGWQDGHLVCSADVAQDFNAYVMDTSETAARPQNALATLSLGQTYRLDVYYYLEGTDADSADYLYDSIGDLHVGLFATLDGEA